MQFSEEKRQKLRERRPERQYKKGLKAFRRKYGPPVSGNATSGATLSDAGISVGMILFVLLDRDLCWQ